MIQAALGPSLLVRGLLLSGLTFRIGSVQPNCPITVLHDSIRLQGTLEVTNAIEISAPISTNKIQVKARIAISNSSL